MEVAVGTVKVNVALDRLPVFTSHPGIDPQIHGGTIVLAESLEDVENAFQEAVAGEPSSRPFADICIPSVFDDSLAPEGKHVMSMFTQWVPHEWSRSRTSTTSTRTPIGSSRGWKRSRRASPTRSCTAR